MSLTSLRALVLLLIVFTGYTGLVYEVTWHRYLANLIGSQARAAAIILSVFLGGLCVGYALFGKASRGCSTLKTLKWVGWIEVGIGVWGLLFPSLYNLVWTQVGILPSGTHSSLVVDAVICIALIGVPTVLMGGTLPLLTQGLSKDLNDAPSLHAQVYAVNTGGAFIGCLTAGFFLLPAVGLPLSLFYTAPLNIVVGIVLLGLAPQLKGTTQQTSSNESSDTSSAKGAYLPIDRRSVRVRAITLAFLAGFYSLTLQIVFMRLVGLSMGSSEYAFSMIVGLYIFMLAYGAWSLRSKPTRIPDLFYNQLLLLVSAIVVYLTIPYWPYTAHVVRSFFASVRPAFYVYHGFLFLLLGLLLALSIGAMGRTMPLLFAASRSSSRELGTLVGKLYAWNTLGCVFGALGGGYLFLYAFDLDTCFRVCIFLMSFSLILSFPWKVPDNLGSLLHPRFAIVISFLALVIPFTLTNWPEEYFARGTFRQREATPVTFAGHQAFYNSRKHSQVLAYKDGPNTSVSVIRIDHPDSETHSLALYVNGKSDGATTGGDLATTRLASHLPALFSSSDQAQAAVIGFGTGITVGSLAQHENIGHIDVIEISPFVKRFAHYFKEANHDILANPKTHWHTQDAYRFLASSPAHYSIIVSEPSNPWVSGVERLYTSDFYELVKAKLDLKGIYSQWFQLYSVSIDTLGMVLNTFSRSFPEMKIFLTGNDLIMLGSETSFSSLDWNTALNRFSHPPVFQELEEIQINSLEKLLALEIPLRPEPFGYAGIHSLEFPQLSFAAGKDFFTVGEENLSSVFDREDILPWVLSQESKFLFHQASSARPLSTPAYLEALLPRRCSSIPLELSDWEQLPGPCRAVLVARVLSDSQFTLHGEKAEVQLLRWLTGLDPSLQKIPRKIEHARRAIDLFLKFYSAYSPFPANRLLQVTQICFQSTDSPGQECLSELSRALAVTGNIDEAKKVFSFLKSIAPPATIQRSHQHLVNAEKAWRGQTKD